MTFEHLDCAPDVDTGYAYRETNAVPRIDVSMPLKKAQRKKQILVVEDDPWIRELLTFYLTMKGFKVAAVANGFDALEYLATGPRPRAVVLDIMMPVMDGQTFLQHKNANVLWEDIPTVITSAIDDPGSLPKTEAYLRKPLDLEQLVNKLEVLCGH